MTTTQNMNALLDSVDSYIPKENRDQYVSREFLSSVLSLPLALFPESVKYAIPSMVMRKDGPAIKSVFLISENLLAEVLVGKNETQFDFAPLTIFDYRIVKKEEPLVLETTAEGVSKKETIMYKTAVIRLVHYPIGMSSEIGYVGDQADEWLQQVTKVLPVTLVRQVKS